MAVTYFFEKNIPSFICLSTDVSGSKVPGISVIGARVLFTDTGTEWVVGDDLKLVHYATNTVSGTSGSSSSSSGSNIYVTNLTNPLPTTQPSIVIDSTFSGQIIISSSSVPYSGSNLSVTNRNGFLFKPNPANTGVVWLVNTGGNTTGSGFPLSVGENFLYSGSGLSYLDYGTSVANACLCWAKL